MTFHLQFAATAVESGIQLVEMVFGLLDVAFEARDGFSLDSPIEKPAEGDLLAIDQLLKGDLDVLANDAILLGTLLADLDEEWIERVPHEVQLHRISLGQTGQRRRRRSLG
jgi:hypothetical protein